MRITIAMFFLIALLFAAMVFSLVVGKYDITAFDALRVFVTRLFDISLANPLPRMHEVIVWDIRAPRLGVAVLSGVATLALMQGGVL